MPSVEMLRKLLDEFVEKQALIDEEMNVVMDQIQQLEKRLEGCRSRLSTIGADRERVLSIRDRYLENNFLGRTSSTGGVEAAQWPLLEKANEPSAVEVAPTVSSPRKLRGAPAPAPVPTPAPVSAPTPAPPAPEPAPPVQAEETYSGGLNDVLSDSLPEPAASATVDEGLQSAFHSLTEETELTSAFDSSGAAPPVPTPSTTMTGINALLNKRSSGSVPIPPAPMSTAPQPAEPPASPPGADSAFGVLDRFKDEVPQSQDSSASEQATSQPSATPVSADAAQSEDASAEKDNLVDLGDETADDGDTVKSINDALRSLFR